MNRSTILRLALAIATVSLLSLAPASATHTSTCSTSGLTAIAANSAVVDSVDNGQKDHFKVTVGGGEVGLLHLQMFNGDVDLYVCKVGAAAGNHVCYSHNTIDVPDGCHLYDANLPDQDDPIQGWGKPLEPGTYRVTVVSCFSSTDGDGCDYTANDPITGDIPVAPGGGDALPAVQYVLGFASA